MFTYETQILQRLAVLVVCHGLTSGHPPPQYFLIQRPMSWDKARDFCQRHYADLAVLSSQEQYFHFVNDSTTSEVSIWLGLQRQSRFSSWEWVDGQELRYEHWHRNNYEGRCASLEAMLKKNNRMLARYCEELHTFACQGPDSLEPVNVDSVGSDYVSLRWNVSAFMQMTPHNYSVTTCTSTCDSHLYHYSHGSAVMSITISNLTSATQYTIEIYAFVARPDIETGRKNILKSYPTALQVTTDTTDYSRVVIVVLTSFKLVCLAPLLWVLYDVLRKDELKDCGHVLSPVQPCAEDTVTERNPGRTRGVG